jgi:hypothetical protein
VVDEQEPVRSATAYRDAPLLICDEPSAAVELMAAGGRYAELFTLQASGCR